MPTTLGSYTLHEELGHGGFAAVYRAIHNTLGSEVAVKVLDPAFAGDEKTRQRFIREAQTAARLDHPHIVRVLDMDEDQGQVFIVMDYYSQGDLRRWIKEHGPLSRPELLRILGEVASALDYIHARKLVHRDVKPGNILMDSAGGAHLSDFGLARPAGAPHLTQIGSVVGTVTYLSPEQAESRPQIDGRADQYSLAVIAYELLAGRPPFEGENSTAVSLMHVTRPPAPPSQLNDAIPAEVDETLLQALAKNPAERYPTCAEFVRSLRTAYEGSDLRRFRELLAEARALLEKGQYAEVRQRLDEARTLLAGRPELGDALAELEKVLHWAETYERGVKEWRTAKQKAQAVLDLFPVYPDPQDVFVSLGLRQSPRKLPPPAEIAKQAGVGVALALPAIALVMYLAFRWMVRP